MVIQTFINKCLKIRELFKDNKVLIQNRNIKSIMITPLKH
jgi:hypothetical protein